ncbi:hypothetical protein EI94DRAFT_1819251 [Lactarius quietus]|nr:hypothetical protein EI94DRAFT_1819251 [Lactarius quietus]
MSSSARDSQAGVGSERNTVEHVRAVAEQDQAEQDLAEAHRRFPTPTSSRVEEDEGGLLPVEGGDVGMETGSDSEEDSDGETDKDTAADEASILQPSTAFTSTTAVDQYDSDKEDNDSDESYRVAHIVCTQCDNPPNYCHCAPLQVPPRTLKPTKEANDDAL